MGTRKFKQAIYVEMGSRRKPKVFAANEGSQDIRLKRPSSAKPFVPLSGMHVIGIRWVSEVFLLVYPYSPPCFASLHILSHRSPSSQVRAMCPLPSRHLASEHLVSPRISQACQNFILTLESSSFRGPLFDPLLARSQIQNRSMSRIAPSL